MYLGTYLGNLTVHSTVPVLSIKCALNELYVLYEHSDLIWGTFEKFNGEKIPEIMISSPNNTACLAVAGSGGSTTV